MNEVDRLSYSIIPAQASGQVPVINLHNQVYRFWKGIWSETLEKMKLPPLDLGQILRQDYICFLTLKNEVIGSHLYSIFDIRKDITIESEYFAQAKNDLIEYCKLHKVNTLMTQEYLAVHPEWRKTQSGISLPELIIGLGIKMMQKLGCDSTVGTIREGAQSVERISREIKADLLPCIVSRYNMPHKFFIARKEIIQLPGNIKMQELINKLWHEKKDYSHFNDLDKNSIAA